MWLSKKKEDSLAQQMSDLVAEMQKAASKLENDRASLEDRLKKLGIDISDDDMQKFGPVLKKMTDDNASADEIIKSLKKMRNEMNESVGFVPHSRSFMVVENALPECTYDDAVVLTALLESHEFCDAVSSSMVNEGFIKDMLNKAKDKLKNAGAKALKFLGDKTMQGILALGGLAASIATGGWGAALILRAMYIVERHGKQLRNAFERQWRRFANSGGVIA